MKKIHSKPVNRLLIRQFYYRNLGCFILKIVQTLIMALGNLLLSWTLQQAIDLIAGVYKSVSLGQLIIALGICVCTYVLAYMCNYFSMPQFVARAMAQYIEHAFQRIFRKSIAAFSIENTSRYVSALSNDTNTIESKYLASILDILEQSIILVAALIMMMWYSPTLTLVSVVLALLPIAAYLFTGRRVAMATKNVSDSNEKYISALKDSLEGFSVIKSFRAETQICSIFTQKVREVARAKEKRQKLVTIVQMLSAISAVLIQLGIILIGAFLSITDKGITAGTVLVFVQLLNYVLGPVQRIPNCATEYKSAKILINKMAETLSQNVRENRSTEKKELQSITLRDISFAYDPNKPVLHDIDMVFEKGKSYAIVGASGSGKSTLLNLLLSSHHQYEGEIYFDELEMRQITTESLYEIISMIQQNVFIFNASIRDNITMFSAFSDEEVNSAIAMAGLSDLIKERGMEYMCGERGNNLSGGERQRVAIARSLLKKSQVLLVDEATAALDAQTAFNVSQAILDLKDMTRIVVTHSMDASLLKQYDLVLTLKNGTVIESGSFEELLEKKGYFYSLYTVSQ